MITLLILHIREEEYPAVFWHVAIEGKLTDNQISRIRSDVLKFTSEDPEILSDMREREIWEFIRKEVRKLGKPVINSLVVDIPCFTGEPTSNDWPGDY